MIFSCKSLSPASILDTDLLCQGYLNLIYLNVHPSKKNITNNLCEVYGEILYPSVDKLLSAIQLSDKDVFVDYGSGLGKMVIQVFLKSSVKQAYGIEIIPELHQEAVKIAEKIEHELPKFYENHRSVQFFLGNFLEVCFTSVTVAMLVSTCFTQPVLNALGTLLEASPSIHTVLSLRPISTLQRLKFKKTIRIECSWDSALCYLYQLPG